MLTLPNHTSNAPIYDACADNKHFNWVLYYYGCQLRDELEHLLDDDMDMAEMYLTAKLFSPQFEDSESKQNNIDDDDTVVLEDYR